MNIQFGKLIGVLEERLQVLLQMPPVTFTNFPKVIPKRGVYLFSEGQVHLYTGRSNGIRTRLRNHCRPKGGHNVATFAFRMARKITGNLKATYKAEGSRAYLTTSPDFITAFTSAKDRIRKMDVRFVQEDDPVTQALLEIYVAVVLCTPFNDFENH